MEFFDDFIKDGTAHIISTQLDDNDIIMDVRTKKKINALRKSEESRNQALILRDQSKHVKTGQMVLFHGPPGTGKTLAAAFMGKYTSRDVYRIDLSMVVSKYIGETEKNLTKIFTTAENKDLILFFDEADAIFGKRTEVSDSHDRYSNQQITLLLQKIESYNGLIIFSANNKESIDKELLNKIGTEIYFPLPTPFDCLEIFRKAIPAVVDLRIPGNKHLMEVFENLNITANLIIRIALFCALDSLANKSPEITTEQIKVLLKRWTKSKNK